LIIGCNATRRQRSQPRAFATVPGHDQSRAGHTPFDQRESAQRIGDVVMTLKTAVREQRGPQRAALAKGETFERRGVADGLGFYPEPGEDSDEIARWHDHPVGQSKDQRCRARPAAQMIFRLAAVIVEQDRFAVELRDQYRRRGRDHERKIRGRENVRNVEAGHPQ
jgi:hypothetical protein